LKGLDVNKMVVVCGAILVNNAGQLFVTRRAAGALSGLWEFPGGKVNSDESLIECLEREIYEELSVRISQPQPFFMVDFDYSCLHLRMFTFLCRIDAVPTLHEHAEGKWVSMGELADLPLAPPDRTVSEELLKRFSILREGM